MIRKLMFAAAFAISSALSGAASADSVNFVSGPAGFDTFTPTSVNISNPSSTFIPIVGSYWSWLPTPFCSPLCVTFSLPSFNGGPETITIAFGGHTDTIVLDKYAFDATNTSTSFNLTGTGTSVLDGGASIPIAFAFSSQLTSQQAPGAQTSFSATISTLVPLPGALVLFGSGLVGLAALGRKRKQRKPLDAATA